MANLTLSTGDRWNTSGVYDTALLKTQQDINSSIQYVNGSYTESTVPVFGVITGGAKNAEISVLLPKMIGSKTLTITSLIGSLRTVAGGYVGGGTEYNFTSLLANPIHNGGAYFRVSATNSSGWGITNNTPINGTVTVSFTIS